jgi:hypothetical protein
MNEHREASVRLTFDFDNIESGMYSKVTKAIVSKFNLEVAGTKKTGLDAVFQDFKCGNNLVGLEWGNWSGYIVNAKNKAAERLITEIANYVSVTFRS